MLHACTGSLEVAAMVLFQVKQVQKTYCDRTSSGVVGFVSYKEHTDDKKHIATKMWCFSALIYQFTYGESWKDYDDGDGTFRA